MFQIALCLLLLGFYRRNVPVFVFLFFALFYFYVPKHFFLDGFLISYHSAFQDPIFLNKLVVLNVLFMAGVVLTLGHLDEKRLQAKIFCGMYESKTLFTVIALTSLGVAYYGQGGESIIESGGYQKGEFYKSTIFEYFILLIFALMIVMNPKSVLDRIVLYLLVGFYTLKALLFGGRIEVVQLLLLVVFFRTSFFLGRYRSLMALLVLSVTFNILFETLRNNPSLIMDPLAIFDENNGRSNVVESQFGDVTQSSLGLIAIASQGYVSSTERVLSLYWSTLGSWLPTGLRSPLSDMRVYLQGFESSGGGGLIAAHAFLWLSWLGPIVLGSFVGLAYRSLYHSSGILISSYGMLVAITFPRWFAYHPLPLFKFCLLGIFMVIAISFYHQIVSNASGGNRSVSTAV